MTDMIERVAKALAESRNVYSIERPDGRDDRCVASMDFDAEGLPITIHFRGTWDECQAWIDRAHARAAIAAMREPTPDMVAVGRAKHTEWEENDEWRLDWLPTEMHRAMIDAALAEGAPKPPNEPA